MTTTTTMTTPAKIHQGDDVVATTPARISNNETIEDDSEEEDEDEEDQGRNDESDSPEDAEDDEGEDEMSLISASSVQAQTLRLQGKQAHDEGEFYLAADLFSQAAQALLSVVAAKPDGLPSEIGEEYATCRLHQALCYLKTQDYQQCLETCSELLEPSPSTTYSSAVRARAYHRRAKARLGLDEPTLALEDARAAAFLGDSKAVQLYGKLMRQVGGSGSSDEGATSDSLLQALLQKSTTKNNDDFTNGDDPTASWSTFNPASLLFGGGTGGNLASSILDSLTGKRSGAGTDASTSSLASSVLQSLSKRLDDPATHTSVATVLQKTTKAQLSQYASMAGVAIPEPYLESLESFCQAITARKISWTIKLSKLAIFVTQLFRRVAKLLRKYRSLVVCVILLQWTKSAVLRPIPIDRAAAKKGTKKDLKKP
jgi:tetratricopeptide (TPR) repeat protein